MLAYFGETTRHVVDAAGLLSNFSLGSGGSFPYGFYGDYSTASGSLGATYAWDSEMWATKGELTDYGEVGNDVD